MKKAYLLLGGNIGDTLTYFIKALEQIKNKAGRITGKSKIYRTKAWGKTDQPDFLNMAIIIKTKLSPFSLLKTILEIEHMFGRARNDHWSARTLDIDILLYENEIIDEPDLKIPHPFLQQRRFALLPLNEIASTVIHPLENKKIKDLLEVCPDTLKVDELKV